MLKKAKNQKGFTLIELIAVIAILGILALLIVPRVGNYTQQAKVSKAKGDITILKNAIERYNAEHSTSIVAGNTLSVEGSKLTGTSTGVNGSTVGPYIDKLPTDSINSDSVISGIMKYDTSAMTTTTPSAIPFTIPAAP